LIGIQLGRLAAINVQLNVQFKSLTRHSRVILTYHRAATGLLPVTESFVLPPDPEQQHAILSTDSSFKRRI
jgi:hypothetical protein